MAVPTLADVLAYLGETSSASATVQGALDAEYANQLRSCRVVGASATYPADMAEALKRRVARNLALRNVPLSVLQGDSETVAMFVPRMDAEIRRYEAPWRRTVVG